MKIQGIRTIAGPNIYHNKPVLIMTLDLEDLAEVDSTQLEGFTERLVKLLPGLKEHRCSLGYAGGFIERLSRGTYFAHIVEHIALELSDPAGISVGYGKSIYGDAPGIYKVIVRYQCEEGMKYLLHAAVELAEAVQKSQPFNLEEKLQEARSRVEDNRLGPSTQAIVDAAEKRNIPWTRMNEFNMIQFGYGKNRKIIQATTTSSTSDIAVDIAQDKDCTKKLLSQASIRVPRGAIARSEDEALHALKDLGGPVVIKPVDGHHGNGVYLGLRTESEVKDAFARASEFSSSVIVEELFTGKDFRILLVDGKMIAAAERTPAHVVGDGVLTLAQLIETENSNPLRGKGHGKALTQIKMNEEGLAFIEKNGWTLNAVPARDQTVFLRETANLSTGGSAKDVTDEVHPEIRSTCERAARIIGLDICGIDLMAQDITRPLSQQNGGIIEVNAGPGIRMHQFPSFGKPRDVGGAIVESLYPKGSSARIPIVSITGTNGKTTVTRLVGHVLQHSGKAVGMTTSEGISIDGHRVVEGDTTGPISARTVLNDPCVEIAVLETARGGIVRRGLGYDWSDVGIITSVTADHIGQDGIETIDDILRIKSLIAERVREGGTLILNADDSKVLEIPRQAHIAKTRRNLVYFSVDPQQPEMRTHIAQGGTAYYLSHGAIFQVQNQQVTPVIAADQLPFTFGSTAHFHIRNAMAAIAACRASGVNWEIIKQSLMNFLPHKNNPGRTNFYRVSRGFVVVDYGHNPEALKSVSEMTHLWQGREVTGIIAAPGDRADEMIAQVGEVAAKGFQKVIVREDVDLRGRVAAEAAELLQSAIFKNNPQLPCQIILDESAAIRTAVHQMKDGGVVVWFYDDMKQVQKWLSANQALPVTDFDVFSLRAHQGHLAVLPGIEAFDSVAKKIDVAI